MSIGALEQLKLAILQEILNCSNIISTCENEEIMTYQHGWHEYLRNMGVNVQVLILLKKLELAPIPEEPETINQQSDGNN